MRMMKQSTMKIQYSLLGVAALLALVPTAYAFDSGSTGADGALSPTVSTVLDMPEEGIFNFTDITIPEGVTVTLNKNTTNTPVVMLASGDVTIAGTLSVAGEHGAAVGSAGDGSIGDDGLPGKGGPGGFDGGRGGYAGENHYGASGLGPGAGQNGYRAQYSPGGSGGSFGSKGGNGAYNNPSYSGPTYGSALLLPLIGGSGGGGGGGGTSLNGSGGGGGGGALLLAASGTVTVTGMINANGGVAGDAQGGNCGSPGGSGSGGGIRIVATTLTGEGTIRANGGASILHANCTTNGYFINRGGYGGGGRIRLEAETYSRTAATSPAASIGEPGELFIAGLPTLRIAGVAGTDAPASPTGYGDITLPADTPNPVTVTFEATGIPIGNTVDLTLTPASGQSTSAISNALDGTTELSTASTTIELPAGASTLSASVTYTITLAMAERLQFFAEGEQIASIKVQADQGKPLQYFLITKSGRVIPIAPARLAGMG